ncbi:dephospho-CoA kinase [Paraoerskovia marina]|uniref:dephospho-CoA kinase n=1 Tax=Paraoerskovia marina TaxID=545619 RepID=UPI0004925632|nr:dephospho-CoA kinase [Paraoerskovia marina]
MIRIGLTGGIAAGKSTASRRLASLGATVIDYDLLAREAVRPGSVGLGSIVEAFGEGVLGTDGELDRPVLADLVFDDPSARATLDSIVHPEVHRLAAERDAEAGAAAENAVVVHDVPLLAESGRTDQYHLVVVVDAPEDVRLARLVEERGLSVEGAEARLRAQASDVERRSIADVVLDGSSTTNDLDRQVDRLWGRLMDEAREEQPSA